MEYGACEKPVVATNVTETANLIEHGTFGYVAKPGNDEEYGNYIIKLLSKPKKAQEMGQNFYEFVKEKYQWTEIATNLEKLLVKN